MVEAFHVVSMESGELLFSVTQGLNGHVDAEIEELQQSLKLYAIYCLMKQCATDEESGDCWMKNGSFCFIFREIAYHRSEERIIAAVVILVKSSTEMDLTDAKKCLNDLVDAANGSPGSRRDRCKALLTK